MLGEIAASADIRRHEIVTPLSEQLTLAQAQELQRLVEARRWDIYRDPFESEDAFEVYSRHIWHAIACRGSGRGCGNAGATFEPDMQTAWQIS